MNSIRLALIGNLDNRRIRDFAARWGAATKIAPLLLDYQALPSTAPEVDLLRIDSPGENAELCAQLLTLGGAPGILLEHGEVAHLREFHLGYLSLLERIQGWGIPAMNAPAEIAIMFDKWQSHQRFLAAGLARPKAELAPNSVIEWRQQRPRSGRIFLKPLHGSSGSGVCAIRWNSTHQQLLGPISVANGKLFNSLRVRSYQSWAEIEFILERLLPQGMISEHWIPKLSLAQGTLDVRVLVIAGEARHRMLRASNSPLTNLHLGNRRADPSGLERVLDHAAELAERAAACFPDALYAGVDVLLDAKGRAFIGEINAFGDLLPGLKHRGEDAYGAIVTAARGAKARVRGAANGKSFLSE